MMFSPNTDRWLALNLIHESAGMNAGCLVTLDAAAYVELVRAARAWDLSQSGGSSAGWLPVNIFPTAPPK